MKNKFTAEDVIVTTSMLAKLYGVSSRTIQNWVKDGLPKAALGEFSLREVIKWHNRSTPDSDISKLSLKDQKTYYEIQHRKTLTELQQIKLAINNGEYLRRDFVKDELSKFFVIFKRSVLALGKRVVSEVAPLIDSEREREIDELVTDDINNALSQLSVDGVYEQKKQ